MSDVRLDGKIALVTGATKGIGKAIVLALADAGASVFGAARSPMPAADLEAMSRGGRFAFIQADVSRWRDCQRLAEAACERYGHVDILVNNAGTSMPHVPIASIEEAAWREVVGVTLEAVVFMSRAVLPGMIARKDGVIINIASTAGVQTGAGMGAYAAAKAAVIQLTKVIAVENIQNGVRANALLVGATDTNLVHRAMAEFGPQAAAAARDGRVAEALVPLLLKPQGVASAAVLLCAEGAREINGAAIAIDRGLLAGTGHTMLMESLLADLVAGSGASASGGRA